MIIEDHVVAPGPNRDVDHAQDLGHEVDLVVGLDLDHAQDHEDLILEKNLGQDPDHVIDLVRGGGVGRDQNLDLVQRVALVLGQEDLVLDPPNVQDLARGHQREIRDHGLDQEKAQGQEKHLLLKKNSKQMEEAETAGQKRIQGQDPDLAPAQNLGRVHDPDLVQGQNKEHILNSIQDLGPVPSLILLSETEMLKMKKMKMKK